MRKSPVTKLTRAEKGQVQAFVDFFYLTNETTPSMIQPSRKLQEEYKLNKRTKRSLPQTQESLKEISNELEDAEIALRNN